MITQDKIKKILSVLECAYGRPEPFKRDNPIDVLIRTILSQNTTDKNSLKAFAVLKAAFRPWDKVLASDAGRIAGVIKHAGLANIKARRIKNALAEIKKREGKLSLVNLPRLDAESALGYLTSLKGVGPKTAACVLLFSFGRPVMPVDTHIFRVARRLGLIDKKVGIEDAHKILTKIIPKHLICRFHLCIIEHGRRTCKAQTPKCGVCVVYRLCKFARKEYCKSLAEQV
ncbi:MAG: endonuclease III [Candidatus Omnitrophota bacterium]